MASVEDNVRNAIENCMTGIDEDTIEYLQSLIMQCGIKDKDQLAETVVPFMEGFIAEGDSADHLFDIFYAQLLELNAPQEDADAVRDVGVVAKLKQPVIAVNVLSAEDQAACDTLWGFDSIRSKKNDTMEVSEAASAKYERRAEKEQRQWLNDIENQYIGEEEDNTQIVNMIIPTYLENNKECDIHVRNVVINFSGKLLLEDAELRIVYGKRYGLVGRNGVGKTTLLKKMANFSIDGFPKHHRVLHVKQEVAASEATVLEAVLSADVERTSLLAREKELIRRQENLLGSDGAQDTGAGGDELDEITQELSDVYQRMEITGVRSAESRIGAILSGLQFTEEMQRKTTAELSGGWRMRVSLAAALFIKPDLLMLDEPTNHLDLQAVLWLEQYLITYPHTVLVVSHDRSFLDEVCTDMIQFKNLKLWYYKGNYSAFEAQRAETLLVTRKQYEAQQVKVKHMQEFIDKFRCNAKRASLVQSRIKQLEKEVLIELEDDEEELNPFNFVFPDCGQLSNNVVLFEDVSFGYPSPDPTLPPTLLFEKVTMNITQTSRVALVGPNGCGKSTLLKLIQSKIQPTTGVVKVSPQLRISIFTQHHLDSFDLSVSPLHNLMVMFPKASEADLRGHLGGYEIHGTDALKPMKFSSGGQKSRVAFAAMTFNRPHVVILDEPTNHLDMESIKALSGALKKFSGGVLLISHDQYFIKSVCDEIWVIENAAVKTYDGSFDEYKKSQLSKLTRV